MRRLFPWQKTAPARTVSADLVERLAEAFRQEVIERAKRAGLDPENLPPGLYELMSNAEGIILEDLEGGLSSNRYLYFVDPWDGSAQKISMRYGTLVVGDLDKEGNYLSPITLTTCWLGRNFMTKVTKIVVDYQGTHLLADTQRIATYKAAACRPGRQVINAARFMQLLVAVEPALGSIVAEFTKHGDIGSRSIKKHELHHGAIVIRRNHNEWMMTFNPDAEPLV